MQSSDMNTFFHYSIVTVGIIVCLHEILGDLNVERDAKLSTPELIEAYGYPAETHKIKTDDGYFLEVHRIAAPGKRAVILMHGLLDSSTTWVLLGPGRSLGYILYDLGYDVWLTNARGNDYSTGHVKYNRYGSEGDRKKYWNFSFHEIGKYDLPATIDYVLKRSNYSQLHYVGHSQGCTVFFIMASERPEYNKKIALATVLAPPVFMKHLDNELLLLNVRYIDQIQGISDWLGMYHFTNETNNMIIRTQNSFLCYFEPLRHTQLCNNNFSPIIGNLTDHVDKSMMPKIVTHVPAGASMKQMYHFAHLVKNRRFCQYDHGVKRNLEIYGSAAPPDYNLKNCTAKIAIVYAEQDTLVNATDVRRLPRALPNVIKIHRVEDEIFNHIDFVWARDAKELLYDYITSWMNAVENKELIQSN